MKKTFSHILFLNLLFCSFVILGYSQEIVLSDTLQKSEIQNTDAPELEMKVRKNIIHINVSNPMLISDRFQAIGYERVLRNGQSFTVNFGTFGLPKFLSGKLADSLNIVTDTKDKGFHFSADYRFYLLKLNRYGAPRGVYIGPYYTLNYLNRRNSWSLDGYVDEVFTNTKISVNTVGFELGYQFIFWNRVALDLILIGPGVGIYGIKTEIGTTLDPGDESKLFDKLNEMLEDRIPGYDRIIDAGEYAKKGSYRNKNLGYRYVVRLGIMF